MNLVKEQEKARNKIIHFAQKWGREYLDLACHAAFPLAVTPELLYCLRENFLPQCPWIAIADLILSPLCDPVGDELYEMDGVVRDLLLKRLATDIRFEQDRLNQLADFMGAYIEAQLPTYPRADRDLGKTPEWIALAYINGEDVQRLQQKLEELLRSGNSKVRQRLANFLENEEDLLVAAGLKPLIVEVFEQWRLELETFEAFEFEAEVAIIVFGEETNQDEEQLQQWEFKTPIVNRRGETIKTTTHTASYFSETLIDDVDLDMVAIPGGTFTMGSPKNEGSDYERPQHEVAVSGFFMGKYPVTQVQWRAIASKNGLKVKIDLNPDPSRFKGDERPVERVNWDEVVEFCQRLSKLTGRDYRLPSEAEWEYACRGVIKPLDREKEESYPPFYFGETITENLANYNASSTYADEPQGKGRKETTPVGQFPPNAFGLYDMHGNVFEWCADDWHENYKGAPTNGSAWIDSNEEENINRQNESYSDKSNDNESYAVLRGGSWIFLPDYCRSATRNFIYRRDDRNFDNGFRVVCGFGRTL